MNHFATLFLQLDQIHTKKNTSEALETFLTKASPSDCLWMVALFTGRYPKPIISIYDLKEWVLEKTGLPEWLFEETYHMVGDLTETLTLLIQYHHPSDFNTLSEWMVFIQNLSKQNLTEKKKAILTAWNQLNSKERFIFNKLLIGRFRLKISQTLLTQALANFTGIDSNVIAHRLMKEWDPFHVDPHFLFHSTKKEIVHTRPYPFCLAYPLDIPIENLGPCSNWLIEWKWDGIRAQLLHRPEFFTIWSREEEVVNNLFPDLLPLKDILPEGVVIDGEILVCQNDKILSFQVLQQRMERKKISPTILKQFPVIFLAYDLLEWEGKDLRFEPLNKRRSRLESFLNNLPEQHVLRLSPHLTINQWEELYAIRQQSRYNQAKGIMLKKLDSIYDEGRKRGNWWKWQIEPHTIKAVLLYAEKQYGRQADVFSNYTFSVWNKQGLLVPFAKTHLGLTKKELSEINRFIKAHTLEKFGPIRSIIPKLVFEITFEDIYLSKRHKSGVVVRFPRIQRWLHHTKPEEADTVENLKALITSTNQP